MLANKYAVIASLVILIVLVSPVLAPFQITMASQGSTLDYQHFVLDFLENVIGFDNYDVVSFSNSTNRMLDSQHNQTNIRIVIRVNSSNFEALFTLIDNELWTYYLELPSDLLVGEKSVADCLVLANKTVERYSGFSKRDCCNGFAEMISTAIRSKSLLIENENALLEISHGEKCITSSDYKNYVNLQWSPKIEKQFISRYLSLGISISKNGLVTMLSDSLKIRYIAGTARISMEKAVNIAIPYAKAYAQDHGQEITSVNATLVWNLDLESIRGDDLAIYPIWDIKIIFDNINEESVSCYGAIIWADNGEVYTHTRLSSRFISIDNGTNMYLLLGILVIIASILVLSGFNLHRKRTVKIKARVKR